MPNRLTRDEILNRALNRVDSYSLNEKDRPGGVIAPAAMCADWLQDGLDLFHRTFPWSGVLTSSAVSMTASTNTYSLPSDFTLDVRNGLKIVQSSPRINARLLRKPWSWFLDQDGTSYCTDQPTHYIVKGTSLYVWPWPKTTYAGVLHYYQLPAVLGANTRPNFPDDWTLIEYVELCGKEWTNEKEPGTAITFAHAAIAVLKKSGLGEEAEDDSLQMDAAVFRRSGSGGWGETGDWMGRTTVT